MTQQINRRTVTKGIAWSVPAVALASAAPAFASSPFDVDITPGYACKLPGGSCSDGKAYTMNIQICHTAAETVYVEFTEPVKLELKGQGDANWTEYDFQITPNPIEVLAGGDCPVVNLIISGAPNSRNAMIRGDVYWTAYSVEADGTRTGFTDSGSFRVESATTEPCDNCTALPIGTIVPTTTADDGVATSEEPLTTGADEQVAETQTVEETQVEEAAAEALTDAEELTEPVTETQPIESVSETEVVEESNGAVEGDTE